MKSRFYLPAILAVLLLASCLKDKTDIVTLHYTDKEYAALTRHLDLPVYPLDYRMKMPVHLGGFATNKKDDLATLGRVLFYDKKLSANNTVSCGSCHKPEAAFADDVAFSQGFAGELTHRNSIALGAVANFNSYTIETRLFWDHRAGSVFEQSRQTIENPVEMGMQLPALHDKLLKEDYYRVLFKKAFGEQALQTGNVEFLVLVALEEFVGSIGAFNSKFDEGMAIQQHIKPDFPNFTSQENLGKDLFAQHCHGCHGEGNLPLNNKETVRVANNGLELNYTDEGVGGVTGLASDVGVFKVPRLRNVALTAPYMHDGRFATLRDVISHYNTGIRDHPNLHPSLKVEGKPKRLNLSPEEQDALLAFLNTLTDQASCLQEKYVNPFK
jgi:cytochrome c peroxidase